MYMRIKVGSTVLPSPTDVTISDEILWSSSTGRSVKTGEMLGSVVAVKHTLEVVWTNITTSQYNIIKNALPAGFFSNVLYEDSSGGNETVEMAQAYRSNFTREDGNIRGNTHYYKSVKVSIIEK